MRTIEQTPEQIRDEKGFLLVKTAKRKCLVPAIRHMKRVYLARRHDDWIGWNAIVITRLAGIGAYHETRLFGDVT